MFNVNSIPAGLLLGCLLPGITWGVFGFILHNEAIILNKPGVPYLVAIALNLVVLRCFFKKEQEKTAGGIMMATFAFMLVVFVFIIRIG
ncbi:hypothetical protein DYU05_10370 [Mucilaginibacter terrenus]|uniref:Stationary phase survival protein SurE n=1 Tax=Mucilaginibacter terrenus TaxID=2482727 RepID=A0A3E2NYA5_9SPHI|nr:hypothetical protein [Mucilaginibacter terrenus]RFZ85962.1 hypothetical protein DYU05_10370 [Mucilaginibacter terrenus]